MSMRRSLFVTLDFPPAHGGVARYYAQVLQQLPSQDTVVLAPRANGMEKEDSLQAYRILRRQLFWHLLWPRWLPLLWHMFRVSVAEHIQLIHVGQLLPVGTAALLLQRWKGVPYVVYTHGFDVLLPRPTAWKRWLRNRVLQNADFVVANSLFTEALLCACGVVRERIVLVRPGCSLHADDADPAAVAALHANEGISAGPVVLSVCRLVKRKGVDMVIRAIYMVKKTIPNVRFLLVGDGPEREKLVRLTKELGITHNVRFVGSVPESDLPNYYAFADLFVLTPRASAAGRDVEGFGIVYLEAGAFGKPVIGSRTGGVAEAVQDGVTGILVEPEDVSATATAILSLLSDRTRAARLGSAGQRFVAEECQWEQRVQPLLKKLSSLERP